MKKLLLLGFSIIFTLSSQSQPTPRQHIPLIGTKGPSFKAPSTHGILNFPDDFGRNWKILFAHPRDFTPVCSSEILELADKQDEFNKLGAKIIILSVDRMVSHQSWKTDLESIRFKDREPVKIGFPFVVDSSYSISYSYGMVDSRSKPGQSIRGVFFINPENEIRAFQFYPDEVGRSADEILRTLKALQKNYSNPNVLIPANWKPGDDVMLPFLTKEDKEELLKPDSKVYYLNWYMIYKKSE
jgi:peroxiredoxin 2/4